MASLQKRHLGAEQRRALQLLASSPFGASEAVMFAHGFTRRMLAGLAHTGFVTAERETVKTNRKVGRVKITEEGRQAIQEQIGVRSVTSTAI
jgi:hypothetical protein